MKKPRLRLRLGVVVALPFAFALLLSQRGRADAPVGQFVVNGAVVTDTKTGLIWQKALGMTEVTFDDAQTYCANLTLGGSSAWRAPSIKELQTLADDESTDYPAHENEAFDAVGDNFWVWSSTPAVSPPGQAWRVDFRECTAENAIASNLHAVRCVR
jgi:hypothetical protein